MSRKASILAAFPGSGKSFACRDGMHPYSCYNILLGEIDENNFEESFQKLLDEVRSNFNYVFVPSDIRILEYLKKEQMHFRLFYPTPWLKSEFMLRYKERGDSEEFQQMMDENFDRLIEECENFSYTGCPKNISHCTCYYVTNLLNEIV